MPRPITNFPPQDVYSPGLLRQIQLDHLESEIHSHNMAKGRVADFRRKNESLQSIVWQAEQTGTLLRHQLSQKVGNK